MAMQVDVDYEGNEYPLDTAGTEAADAMLRRVPTALDTTDPPSYVLAGIAVIEAGAGYAAGEAVTLASEGAADVAATVAGVTAEGGITGLSFDAAAVYADDPGGDRRVVSAAAGAAGTAYVRSAYAPGDTPIGGELQFVPAADPLAQMSRVNGLVAAEAEAREQAVAAEAEARDEAIAEAQLATHTWLPAVRTKALLPAPSTLKATLNYLCRVIADSTAANNGVWELIAGADEWTYFSDNADWIDALELAAAIEALPDGSTTELNANKKLAVKDGGIATAKIANGAVTQEKLAEGAGGKPPDGSTIELNASGQLAVKDGGITAAKLAGVLDLSASSYTVSVKTASAPSY